MPFAITVSLSVSNAFSFAIKMHELFVRQCILPIQTLWNHSNKYTSACYTAAVVVVIYIILYGTGTLAAFFFGSLKIAKPLSLVLHFQQQL